MKNIVRNSVIVLVSTLVFSAAQASDGDGGLMAEMMAKKYAPREISDPVVQASLSRIQITNDNHQNGGLMKQLMGSRYAPQVISDKKVQERLALVKIPTGSNN
jgi:hypothetical protein